MQENKDMDPTSLRLEAPEYLGLFLNLKITWYIEDGIKRNNHDQLENLMINM